LLQAVGIDVATAGEYAPLLALEERDVLVLSHALARGGVLVEQALDDLAPGQVTPGVLAVVRRVTGDKGPIRAQLAVDACRRTTARSRSRSTFLGIFGLSSFLLGITGVFSAATEAVRRDKRHTAIRMALGASRQKVVGGVLWKTLSVVACGAAVGLFAGLSVGRSLQGVVFGILPADMLTAASTFASLLSVAAIAAAVPALAASRVDPLTVLRNE
jgi:ABC-type antimicrobial peptide transport system permease subunit